MAQKKSRRGKITTMPPSPENYVRSGKARKLPIHECFMVKDDQGAGVVMIVVVRKHANGHLTGAHFLVDLWCLGVKDSLLFCNLPEHEYEMKVKADYEEEDIELEYIDYPRAHTLIYGAMAFAGKYGFRPHKSFDSCRMVLAPEEELPIDGSVVFGCEGKPTFVASEDDDFSKINKIIATLEKTAGPGNYDYLTAFDEEMDDDDEELDEDLWDEFDEDDEWDDEGGLDDWQGLIAAEIFQPGEMEAISSGKKKPSPAQAFYMSDALYKKFCPSEDDALVEGVTELLSAMEEMTDTPEAILADEDEAKARFKKVFKLMSKGKVDDALVMLETESARDPRVLYPYQLRCLLTSLFDAPLPESAFDGFCKAFPGSTLARMLKAYRLILVGEPGEGYRVMGHHDDINKAFPERYGAFFEEELYFFHTILCAYYTATGQLARAGLIAHEMIYFGDRDDFNLMGCLQKLVQAMNQKIREQCPDINENP